MAGRMQLVMFSLLVLSAFVTSNTSIGRVYKKVTGNGTVFESVSSLTDRPQECSAMCEAVRPRCVGFYYDKQKKTCNLLNTAHSACPGTTAWISGI